MTLSLDIEFTGAEVLAKFDAMPEKVKRLVNLKFEELTEALRTKVADNLSGKVLQTKSGALLGALKSGVSHIGDTTIGFVEIDPPNERVKEYALAHEYGGKAAYWIMVGDKGVLANRETGFFSKRDVIHPPALERSYLRSAFLEMKPLILEGLEEAVAEGLYGP